MNEIRVTDKLDRKLIPGNVVLVLDYSDWYNKHHIDGVFIITETSYWNQGRNCSLKLSRLQGREQLNLEGIIDTDGNVHLDKQFYKLAESPAAL